MARRAAAGIEKAQQEETETSKIARALSHPTRVHVLMSMNAPRRRMSPKEFCGETGMELHHVGYHFRELEKVGYIELVETVPRRGAVEHYYEPVTTALAWTKQWEQLAPVVKQVMSASVMSAAVNAAGAAIDAGTFDARKDRHLSWDTMIVDEEGWEQVGAILDRTLEDLLQVQAECAGRVEEKPRSAFLATYFMSAFEAPSGDS